ncbi:MAG: MBL fold metallo-hydrolase [Gemmatimonadaceae bacterium]
MRITTIGTGTAAPSPARVQSATLVESGDLRLLIDCGSGAVFRMAQLGLDWRAITHVALTHFHADHTEDIANLLYAWRYGTLPPRSEAVVLIGPPGTDALVDHMASAFGANLRETVPLTVSEMECGGDMELASGVLLSSRKVPHTDESVAYSVSSSGRRVVLSGDTGFDRTLGEWSAGSDLFLLECSLPDELAIPTHLTPRQCGELAALARPGLLVLNHFYPPVEAIDIVAQIRERYDGDVVLSHDGWWVDLEET